MKSLLVSVACLVLISCQGNTQDKVELKTTRDSVSYGIGTDIGKNLKAQQIEVNTQALAKGISDAITGGKMMLTDVQIQECMTNFQKDLVTKQQAKAQELGEKNKKEGDAFLAANKSKEGVKTTASGLQYKVEKMGDGPKPKPDQTVTVNYKGTLLDGTEFDNSFKRGEPATFELTRVVKGWIEGLQLMPAGSKFTFYIPPELGWGASGAGSGVPPNATVIFEIELISVK
jgi:FKBP-type peptidyl-prolyl cis-trans isomerase FklB